MRPDFRKKWLRQPTFRLIDGEIVGMSLALNEIGPAGVVPVEKIETHRLLAAARANEHGHPFLLLANYVNHVRL